MVIPVYYRAYIIICERFEALSYLTESGSIQSNMELKATSKARQTLTLPSFRPLLCPLLQLVNPPPPQTPILPLSPFYCPHLYPPTWFVLQHEN